MKPVHRGDGAWVARQATESQLAAVVVADLGSGRRIARQAEALDLFIEQRITGIVQRIVEFPETTYFQTILEAIDQAQIGNRGALCRASTAV